MTSGEPRPSPRPIPVGPVIGGATSGVKKIKSPVLSAEDAERWMAVMCNVRPFGRCEKPQSAGSVFCLAHSCQAFNADGQQCNNLVTRPGQTRYCASGWHKENRRHDNVADLQAMRRAHDAARVEAQERAQAASIAFVEQYIPAAPGVPDGQTTPLSPLRSRSRSDNSPPAGLSSHPSGRGPSSPNASLHSSTSSLSPKLLSPVPSTDGIDTDRERERRQRVWGAHNIDKWWVGKWDDERVGEGWSQDFLEIRLLGKGRVK
ncbi:hypothetical protein IAU60_004046 [Kwoniella sp. DSM 27419]